MKQNAGECNRGKCLTCPDQPVFDWPEMVKHVHEVHQIPKGSKGTRRMGMHLDGTDWFESHFTWTIGDIRVAQCIRLKRAKDDMMRYV